VPTALSAAWLFDICAADNRYTSYQVWLAWQVLFVLDDKPALRRLLNCYPSTQAPSAVPTAAAETPAGVSQRAFRSWKADAVRAALDEGPQPVVRTADPWLLAAQLCASSEPAAGLNEDAAAVYRTRLVAERQAWLAVPGGPTAPSAPRCMVLELPAACTWDGVVRAVHRRFQEARSNGESLMDVHITVSSAAAGTSDAAAAATGSGRAPATQTEVAGLAAEGPATTESRKRDRPASSEAAAPADAPDASQPTGSTEDQPTAK